MAFLGEVTLLSELSEEWLEVSIGGNSGCIQRWHHSGNTISLHWWGNRRCHFGGTYLLAR